MRYQSIITMSAPKLEVGNDGAVEFDEVEMRKRMTKSKVMIFVKSKIHIQSIRPPRSVFLTSK